MRRQLIGTELAKYASWGSLSPAVVAFEVGRCSAVFGFDMNHLVGFHVATQYPWAVVQVGVSQVAIFSLARDHQASGAICDQFLVPKGSEIRFVV